MLRKSRPSWDKPPTEEDGDLATEDQIKSLYQVLLKDASQGPSISSSHPVFVFQHSRSEIRHHHLGFCHGEFLCL